MFRFARFNCNTPMPLGINKKFVTSSKAHWDVSKQGAIEGTVLLKNDGTLPLQAGARVCLFGSGVGEFLFCGGGSGEVYSDKNVTLADGMLAAANKGKIELYTPLIDYYVSYTKEEYANAMIEHNGDLENWLAIRNIRTPQLPEDLYAQAKDYGDTAVFCLSRYSTEGADYGDRDGQEGDFSLWSNEIELLNRLCNDFEKVIVVLNVCGPVSTKEYKFNDRVGAVLYAPYGGGLAGEALAEIILGEAYPSGKLQDTLALDLSDYPGTDEFLHNHEFQAYTEDIFVGYRYFETFAKDKVAYPYGFGLGYTNFKINVEKAELVKNTVKLRVSVENTGAYKGKEVVQVYLEAPQGKLGKAKRVLCLFAKTKELNPKEKVVLNLAFDIRQFGSFDDLGKICKSAFLLEKGDYTVHVGSSVRDTQGTFKFILDGDVICRKCNEYMAPQALPYRLTADSTMEALPSIAPHKHKPQMCDIKKFKPCGDLTFRQALAENRLDEFIAGLSDKELALLLYGHPTLNVTNTGCIGLPLTNRNIKDKIPSVPTADGPAGIRVVKDCGIMTTSFPCATTIAQTWNPRIAERMGVAVAREMKENNLGVWLAPGMNIHRHPLCGRNFEYYSEDPLASGIFAAACVKGVQSQRIGATIKHYCANNKEVKRLTSDSRISQRALREIYLRGFEIAVKTAKPLAVMTSYNLGNGVQSSANWEAINGILRGEWGYDGVVMTDWWACSNYEDELYAGSDIKMPELISIWYDEGKKDYDLEKAISSGELDRRVVWCAVRRVLKMMDLFE